jgi:predicted DNA repair protein MutK
MASGIFLLFDDIAALMDDVVLMSKVATKKTAGILGDDLAVNAEKATGFVSSRELPVLWAITKGSFLNKLIILPIAFLLSFFLPKVITIILVLGGLYLAYEGVEKILEYFFPHQHAVHHTEAETLPTEEEILALEKNKIKSAVTTDFILSIEIVIIALGTVLEKPILFQIAIVSFVAIVATVGVYGIVALIVRLDDIGYQFIRWDKDKNGLRKALGTFLINALPIIIKVLAFVGTLALLLVSGGIFVHNIPFIHDFVHHYLHHIPAMLTEFVVGFVAGLIAVFVFKMSLFSFKKINKK